MKEAVHMLDLLSPDQRKGFLRLFGQFVQQRHKPTVEWARLEPPPPEAVVNATDIPPCPKDQALRHELLDKMVILKLNGKKSQPQCAAISPKLSSTVCSSSNGCIVVKDVVQMTKPSSWKVGFETKSFQCFFCHVRRLLNAKVQVEHIYFEVMAPFGLDANNIPAEV